MAESNQRKKRSRSSRPALSPKERAARIVRDLRALGLGVSERLGLGDEPPLDTLTVSVRSALTSRGHADGADDLLREVEEQLRTAGRAESAFRIGHVFCFLCESAECVHSAPSDPTETFAGYRPTGKPEWVTFPNLCIQRQEPRVDRLFGGSAEIISVVQTAEELTEGLMPGFGRGSVAYRVLGQVVTGLLPDNLDPMRPSEGRIALTLQVVEAEAGRSSKRLRLNLLGASMQQIAEAAADGEGRGPTEALRRTIRTTRDRVHSEARSAKAAEAAGRNFDADGRIGALLTQARGDIERCFRPVRRRTKHAQERHQGGERPTSRALADAREATDERFLHDTQRDTVVVLGPRGRAHVFSREGRHVTSLTLRPGEVDRKTERKRWRRLRRAEVQAFREILNSSV